VSTRSPIGKVLVALATLVVAGATLVLGLARAEPAAAGASCVAVVIDFRHLDGAVQTGCAQGDPSTGLQALGRAGFSDTPRPRDGLICQIDARPACTDTTSTAYWSYWYRAPGSSHWVYASEGAGTHNPKPGSTEAWVWQDGGKTPPPNIRADAICPQLAATPSSTPKPRDPKPTSTPTTKPSTRETTAPTRSTRKPSSATSTPHRRHSPALPSGSATGSPATGSPATGSPATGSPATGSPATSSSSTPAVTQGPPSRGSTGGSADGPTDQGGGGAALGGVAGVALGGLVVLGIGAATVVRSRRGRSS
jgi:hypothetical protein